jgi:hypothetical protein
MSLLKRQKIGPKVERSLTIRVGSHDVCGIFELKVKE